jgi:hypothetical protein
MGAIKGADYIGLPFVGCFCVVWTTTEARLVNNMGGSPRITVVNMK